jgi:hypothetical protein
MYLKKSLNESPKNTSKHTLLTNKMNAAKMSHKTALRLNGCATNNTIPVLKLYSNTNGN